MSGPVPFLWRRDVQAARGTIVVLPAMTSSIRGRWDWPPAGSHSSPVGAVVWVRGGRVIDSSALPRAFQRRASTGAQPDRRGSLSFELVSITLFGVPTLFLLQPTRPLSSFSSRLVSDPIAHLSLSRLLDRSLGKLAHSVSPRFARPPSRRISPAPLARSRSAVRRPSHRFLHLRSVANPFSPISVSRSSTSVPSVPRLPQHGRLPNFAIAPDLGHSSGEQARFSRLSPPVRTRSRAPPTVTLHRSDPSSCRFRPSCTLAIRIVSFVTL